MEKKLPSRFVSDVQKVMESPGPLPEPVSKPIFIVLSGLPGTGKSYFSKKIAQRLPVVILESDALRKVLFPAPTYSWSESARLFRAIYIIVEQLLNKGESLVLDATNLSERLRRNLYRIAERTGAKLILVQVQAPTHLVRERLKKRADNPDTTSDADWKVYQTMRPSVERICRRHFSVDTSRDIDPVIERIIRDVNQ